MTRYMRPLACLLFLLLLTRSVSAQMADADRYALAVIDTPATCNSFMLYSIGKRQVTKPTAVLLYQLIRFAYGVEEVANEKNTFYVKQFGYNPSALRINPYDKKVTIVPWTVDEMAKQMGVPLLSEGDKAENTELLYPNPNIDPKFMPAVRNIIRFRQANQGVANAFDQDPDDLFKQARELLQPLVRGYGIRITQDAGDCRS